MTMNASSVRSAIEFPPQICVPHAAIDANEVRSALGVMLASSLFSKAQRMCRLLSFLVESKLSNISRNTGEYAIGIAVFGRDPQHYNTREDPIVRVQVGRLRARLASYYTAFGQGDALRIVIPVGRYMPEIVSIHAAQVNPAPNYRLAMLPFSCLSQEPVASSFCLGLSDELAHSLFHAEGITLLPRGTNVVHSSHILEGSVRAEGQRLRVSITLTDTSAGITLCAERFDHEAPLGIALQEVLAQAISRAIRHHLAVPADPVVTVSETACNVAILPAA